MLELKKCCHCKLDLPLASFQKNSSAPDGLQYRCKECTKKSSKACRLKRGHLWMQKTNPWKKRNREKSNAATRKRRAANPEKARLENKRWRELQNPFSAAVAVAKRRARILGVLSTLIVDEWKSVVEEKNFICHLCGRKVCLELYSPDRLSLDHITPMSIGGSNTKENVAPSHRRCNQSRLNMTLEEFDSWLTQIAEYRRK